jgi:single stranded DNA-binding protein (ssb)
MVSINRVMLGGYLTADPESRQVGSGTVCHFTIAMNRSWTDRSGQKKEEATFVDCEAWAKVGEVAQSYLKKGRPVFVEGRLKLDRWQGQDGQKKQKLKVNVDSVQFLDSGNAQNQQPDEQAQGAPAGGGAPAQGAYDPSEPF